MIQVSQKPYTPVFSGFHVAWSLVFCVVFCRSFCPFSFGNCCRSIYSFWLPLWYLQTFLKKVNWSCKQEIALGTKTDVFASICSTDLAHSKSNLGEYPGRLDYSASTRAIAVTWYNWVSNYLNSNFFIYSERLGPISFWGSCYSIFSFMCMFCRSLYVPLSFFFCPWCCLSCDLWILITCLVSSNSSNHTFQEPEEQ
jgi:hypothetical protein